MSMVVMGVLRARLRASLHHPTGPARRSHRRRRRVRAPHPRLAPAPGDGAGGGGRPARAPV